MRGIVPSGEKDWYKTQGPVLEYVVDGKIIGKKSEGESAKPQLPQIPLNPDFIVLRKFVLEVVI